MNAIAAGDTGRVESAAAEEAEVKTGSPNAQVDAPNDVSEVASMPAAPAPTDAAATSKTTPTRKGRELPSTESASPANAAA